MLIIFLDDTPYILEAFEKPLAKRLQADVRCLPHTGERLEQVAADIAALHPDWVLLDANLAAGLKGYHLVPLLKEAQPGIRCLGFSSVESVREPFLRAGADGFVLKDVDNVDRTVQMVAECILKK